MAANVFITLSCPFASVCVKMCPKLQQKLSILKTNGRIFMWDVSFDSFYSGVVGYVIDVVYAYARPCRHQGK